MAKRFPPAGGLNSLPEGTLIYEGPECFRGVVADAYGRVREHLDRAGSPRVVVGIDSLYRKGKGWKYKGFPEVHRAIDKSAHDFNKELKTLEEALALIGRMGKVFMMCAQSSAFMPPQIFYANPLDRVVIDPPLAVGYLVASRLKPERKDELESAKDLTGEVARSGYEILMGMPRQLVRYAAVWDLGGARYHSERRNEFSRIKRDTLLVCELPEAGANDPAIQECAKRLERAGLKNYEEIVNDSEADYDGRAHEPQ